MPLSDPVTTEAAVAETPDVVTVKFAADAPLCTVTDDGTAAEPVDDKATAAPPVGAARDRVTVPTAELPPTTVAGATVIACSNGV